MRTIAAFFSLAFLGCIGTQHALAQDQPIEISIASQGEIGSYLQKVRTTRPGAFAVSPDGLDTFFTWCEDIACGPYNYSNTALRGCGSLSGAECIVLYVGNRPRRPFAIASSAGEAGRHGSDRLIRYEYD